VGPPGFEPETDGLWEGGSRFGLSRHVWRFACNQRESGPLGGISSLVVSVGPVATSLPPGSPLTSATSSRTSASSSAWSRRAHSR